MIKKENPKNPMRFLRDIVGDYALDKVKSSIIESKMEGISEPKSIPKGSYDSDLLIVSDSVSIAQMYLEKDIVYPLEGTKGGEMLDKVLDHFNVDREKVMLMNVVNGMPYKEMDGQKFYRTPSKKEVDFYKTYLDYVIDVVRPSQIILLGSIALNVFVQEPVTQARGKMITVRGIPAMPTYHPEYFVQIEGRKPAGVIDMLKDDFVDDIEKALKNLQTRFPENNVLLEKI